ncbi:MAG: ComEC/Rec2 family competence protein [Undibacterium sp.]|nr:ComEC/Rec2 family competence protein [Opitutaceae bacterium]
MTSRSLGHRAPLLWLVLPMIAGLGAGQAGEVARPGWLLAGAVVAGVISLAWAEKTKVWAVAMVTAALLAGLASYGLNRARLPAWDALPPREARLSLRIERTFSSIDPRKAAGLAVVMRSDDHLRELVGQRIYFSLALKKSEAAPVRTTVITTVGVLTALPRNPPGDTFDGYLAGAGVNFRLARGRVLAEERAASGYARFCARAAARFNAVLGLGIAGKRPELAGLSRAMMLGETHELSEEQHELFRKSGTMHLFAISGLNIAVIAGALQMLLVPLRRWPVARFVVGAALLWLFVDITGAAPSAVRAFAMGVFLQAAVTLWKPANVLAALVASAALVLVVTPLQVFGASFVMSYGIVAALLLLGLPLGEAWVARWSPAADLPKVTWRWWHHAAGAAWRWLAAALAIGVATTLVGLLTGVHYFGLLTPGALLTNLILIPAAGLVTLGGFAALLCGLAGWIFGAVLCNHAAALLLLGIQRIVAGSVTVPGAFMAAHFSAAWLGPMALTVLGAGLLAGYALGWRRGRYYWAPFALVAAVLGFGMRFG